MGKDRAYLQATAVPDHPVKDLTAWPDFFVALGELSGLQIGFLPATDFPEYFRLLEEVDLVYASPLSALRLEDRRGFLPLAAPNRYDEVVFLARAGVAKDLAVFANQPFGGVEGPFATFLAQRILEEAGIQPGPLRPYPTWEEVLAALKWGEVERAILPCMGCFDRLSSLAQEGFEVVYVSQTEKAYHLFMLHPEHRDKREALLGALYRLPEHPLGKEALEALGIEAFREVTSTENLRALLE